MSFLIGATTSDVIGILMLVNVKLWLGVDQEIDFNHRKHIFKVQSVKGENTESSVAKLYDDEDVKKIL